MHGIGSVGIMLCHAGQCFAAGIVSRCAQTGDLPIRVAQIFSYTTADPPVTGGKVLEMRSTCVRIFGFGAGSIAADAPFEPVNPLK